MPSAAPGAPRVRPADVERWFVDLGLEPVERAERDGIASWDLVLDGRRRFDLRVTVILDPDLALICWAHFAPPINDMFRKSYRRLLRWNDEFPFAKFSVGEDERPLLAVEQSIPTAAEAGADGLGLTLVRIVGIADRLFDESKEWLWIGGRGPDHSSRAGRNDALIARFEGRLPDLFVADASSAVPPVPDEARG
jgi:Putative bacterial sensory transduction regulator